MWKHNKFRTKIKSTTYAIRGQGQDLFPVQAGVHGIRRNWTKAYIFKPFHHIISCPVN